MKVRLSPPVLNLRVTEEDIQQGNQGSPFYCPIARAAIKLLGDEEVVVHATGENLTVAAKGGTVKYAMSRRGDQFIRRFDLGAEVKPITLRLRRRGMSSLGLRRDGSLPLAVLKGF